MSLSLKEILETAMAKEASDIHLKAGLVPVIRKHGKLRPLGQGHAQLSAKDLEKMAAEILDDEQLQHFQKYREVDCGYGVPGIGRFRINIFKQRGSVRMVIRTISTQVPSIEELHLPAVLKKISDFERGLVLVTGITGSGKSSTLAAIINEINNTKNKHILTIEDPIEYLIRDKRSIISQREIGQDTTTFSAALRAGLRQDPDVILIGEMRDRDTIETALTAAETGHLVLSTVHTVDAQESINRILAAFEHHQHGQVRRQLAGVLKAVISQRLCRKKDKSGFVPAVEILIMNQRVRETIEEAERTVSLRQIMEESRDSFGMQTFDQSLADLVEEGAVDMDEALRMSTNPDDFQLRFSGVAGGIQQWSRAPKSNATWESTSDRFELEIDRGSRHGGSHGKGKTTEDAVPDSDDFDNAPWVKRK
jgi:twitching motility protein PilT